MKTRLRIPHVVGVEVPRPHVVRVTFDDGLVKGGLVKEWEFTLGSHEGTVFEPFDGSGFFRQAGVDPESRTVAWPNGVNLDPVCYTGTSPPPTVVIFATSPTQCTPDSSARKNKPGRFFAEAPKRLGQLRPDLGLHQQHVAQPFPVAAHAGERFFLFRQRTFRDQLRALFVIAPDFVTLAKTIRKHLAGILAAVLLGINNAGTKASIAGCG
jgi:hypothetical protein